MAALVVAKVLPWWRFIVALPLVMLSFMSLLKFMSLKRLSGFNILLRSNGLYGYALSQEKWLRSIWWLVISV